MLPAVNSYIYRGIFVWNTKGVVPQPSRLGSSVYQIYLGHIYVDFQAVVAVQEDETCVHVVLAQKVTTQPASVVYSGAPGQLKLN